MTEEEELTRIDRFELRNGWTMRRVGLKGLRIEAEILGGETPALRLTGSRRGRIEIPLVDIDCIRASIDQGKFRWADSYRCLIWRASERKLVLAPTSFGKIIYGELILELARAMKQVGRFDRVERGLQRWETIFYSIHGPCCGVYRLCCLGHAANDARPDRGERFYLSRRHRRLQPVPARRQRQDMGQYRPAATRAQPEGSARGAALTEVSSGNARSSRPN